MVEQKAKFFALAVFAASLLAFPSASSAATVVNGGFESGLTGWTSFAPDPSNAWVTYSGTTSPSFSNPVPAPPEGTSAALTEPSSPSAKAIYQDVALEPGSTHTLNFTVYYENFAGGFDSPDSFDPNGAFPNQQYRVDVMKATAAADSVVASDILATPFRTLPGAPATLAPTPMAVDLSPFAGQTVRLRFTEIDNQNAFMASVDAVSIVSKDVTAPVLSALKLSPKKLRAAKKGASIAKTKATSSNVSYSLSEAGVVTFTVERSTKGKRSGSKCVKAKKSNKKAKNCTRWTLQKGSFTHTSVAGANKFKFTGRLKNKGLKAGTYRLIGVATDAAGNRSIAARGSFKIVKK
jgi:hypothetical protein